MYCMIDQYTKKFKITYAVLFQTSIIITCCISVLLDLPHIPSTKLLHIFSTHLQVTCNLQTLVSLLSK